MGYETEVFLVDGRHIFGKWSSRNDFWYTKNHVSGDNKELDELPADAQFSDGGCPVATLKLSKIGSSADSGPLAGLFARDREQQKKDKRYVLLQWRMKDSGEDEEPILTDSYGDPYVVHDAKETLEALRETIRLDAEEWKGMEDSPNRHHYVSRRLEMFEAMLKIFIERFPDCAVISRGY